MASYRRKWVANQNWWHIQWIDGTTFKVECENFNLTDKSMEEWGPYMDAHFEKRFGHHRPRLTASTLNFSRNDLGNDGIIQIVTYLSKNDIGVQMLKFFKNNIGDEGAYAIGQLIARSHEPLHEVHLSHNRITEQGACSILESVARSRKYPYPAERSGRRDQRGLSPVWVRIEHNFVNWGAIEHRLDYSHDRLRWCAAESRDGWTPKDQAPMICLHNSYKNQKGASPEWASADTTADADSDSLAAISAASHAHQSSREAPLDGQNLLAALQGGGSVSARHDVEAHEVVGEEGIDSSEGIEEVPMYIFLDASVVHRMMTREDTLFSFNGLLNLCQQGHMTCFPPGGGATPAERDRIILVVTDSALDELLDIADRHPSERMRIDWLRNAQDSYLQVCHGWGILEVLETKLHTQLMKLEPRHETMALNRGISKRAIKLFDFACLWQSQIESHGRVFFVTADEALQRFGLEFGSDAEGHSSSSGTKPLIVLHIDDLDRRFSSDHVPGIRKLSECALKAKTPNFCGAVLNAPLMSQVVDLPSRLREFKHHGSMSSRAEVDLLRQELREAVTLLGSARQLIAGREAREEIEVNRCLVKLDEAQQRWHALLSRR